MRTVCQKGYSAIGRDGSPTAGRGSIRRSARRAGRSKINSRRCPGSTSGSSPDCRARVNPPCGSTSRAWGCTRRGSSSSSRGRRPGRGASTSVTMRTEALCANVFVWEVGEGGTMRSGDSARRHHDARRARQGTAGSVAEARVVVAASRGYSSAGTGGTVTTTRTNTRTSLNVKCTQRFRFPTRRT